MEAKSALGTGAVSPRQLEEDALQKREPILRVGWMAGTALLLGGLFYILFRPAPHLFFTWVQKIGLGELLEGLRGQSVPLASGLPTAIVYSLPQGLWAFAYALLIASFWGRAPSPVRWLWLATIPVVGLGYEVLQALGRLPGTFCWQDLIFGLAGVSLGTIIGWKNSF